MHHADRPPPTLYTVAEVANLLRVSRKTVERWRGRGVVRSVRIEGRRLIPASEIDRLLAPAMGDSDRGDDPR